ncbi:MAG: Hpt domain-containing protein, partial [Cyclobacteriaceae bacterium]
MKKEDEYKEIFLAEALDNYEELNRLITELEKRPADQSAINAIFRITHTLKGNASGMGFTGISELAHTLETLFGEIREQKITLSTDIFTALFKAIDTLGALIHALSDGSKVSYKGIKTKLEVICRQAETAPAPAPAPEPAPPAAEAPKKQRKPKKATTSTKTTTAKRAATKTTSTAKKASAKDAADPASPAPTEEAESKKTSAPQASVEQAVETPPVAQPAPEENIPENKITFSDLVQVPVRKLDNLLNLVGELIIERDRMIASHAELHGANEYARLNRISSDLQYSVMDVRLVQVGFLFNKFHRVVRDAAALEKKQVVLKLEGNDTEIDRNILQIISDSLIHLIRNCVAHGVEAPDERKKTGKPEEGTITLRASNENDGVVIEILDDGKGVDVEKVRERGIQRGLITPEQATQLGEEETIMLIFEPGFSTVEQVNAISGRGVGMDVVKKAL